MASQRAAFIGPRLRRLRRSLGLTQAAMASDLEVSPSYVALIERNHRPLSAELLIRLAERFHVDIASFAGGEDDTLARLEAVVDDPVFADLGLDKGDMRDLAAVNPLLAEAMARLYASHGEQAGALLEARAAARSGPEDPLEDARGFIGEAHNYFDAVDRRAERRGEGFVQSLAGPLAAIAERLEARHKLSLRILPADVMAGSYRRLDRHRGQLFISEALDGASRAFQAALQLTLLEDGAALDEALARRAFETDAGARLARAALANYAAAAMLLPYERFLKASEDLRYDAEALARRFGASFEQIAHRLTTLQRPGAEGVPFFFIRIDAAGNVSKRFSGGVFPFARFGGSCPLWDVHRTFRQPRKILTQIIQLPEGETFLSIARTVHGGAGGFDAPAAERAVALGCETRHAEKIVYADALAGELERPTPIGVTCRLCPRTDCAARAHPPIARRIVIEEHKRDAAPFSFALD